jgi:hypothetical protein
MAQRGSRRVTVGLGVAALLLGACGGSDDGGSAGAGSSGAASGALPPEVAC